MKKTFTDPVVKFFISVVGLVVIFIVLKELQHIFIPLVIAYFLFLAFNPLNKFLQKYKVPMPVTVLLNLGIIIGLIFGISKIIIDSFSQFGQQLPYYEEKLNHIVINTALSFGIKDRAITHFDLSKILANIDYGGFASGVFSSTVSVFATMFFIIFFYIFIVTGHDKIFAAIRKRYVDKNIKVSLKKYKKQMLLHHTEEHDEPHAFTEEDIAAIKEQREIKIQKTFKDITEQVQKYIATKLLISMMTGLVVGTILWLFGVNYFVIWAVFAFLLNFIPNIGSVIAVIMPSLMTLVQYESFGYAILVAFTIIIVQNLIGNVLEPKIFGDRLGINPLVVLTSLLLWGYIWGIPGMLISVPLTAIIKIIISSSNSKDMRFISSIMGN